MLSALAATDGPAARAATLMHEALGATREPDVVLAQFVQTASPSEAEALRRALGQLHSLRREAIPQLREGTRLKVPMSNRSYPGSPDVS